MTEKAPNSEGLGPKSNWCGASLDEFVLRRRCERMRSQLRLDVNESLGSAIESLKVDNVPLSMTYGDFLTFCVI